KINFDQDRLDVAKPSGGTSVINVWTESPKYDNTKGTLSYMGTVPEGLVTDSGLIATVTFKAISSGQASINVSPVSEISLNDGLNTTASLDLGRAEYMILKKTSEGP